jgi:predicted transcriptional regulator
LKIILSQTKTVLLRNNRRKLMADTPLNGDILSLTAQIVSAHVSHNSVPANAVPSLIQEVYRTLTSIERGPAPVAERPEPAVPVKKSITPDYIICLEDGKKLKMLKRHLKTSFNLTPDQYRERWGLGADYPMVAPRYAKHRSSLAKKIGLGTAPRQRANGKA